jgi:hypothetical protein
MPHGLYKRERDVRAPNALSLTETGRALGLTINATYQLEKRAIRRLWRDKRLREKFLCPTT